MNHDADTIDQGMGQEGFQRPRQNRPAGQEPVLLWDSASGSRAASGGKDEGDDWHEGALSVTPLS
jgi:hypothetical protein